MCSNLLSGWTVLPGRFGEWLLRDRFLDRCGLDRWSAGENWRSMNGWSPVASP
jgi:hypothetical protein